MNKKQYFKTKNKEEWSKVAEKSGTNYANLVQIFCHKGSCSLSLAMKISNYGGFATSIIKPELKYERNK